MKRIGLALAAFVSMAVGVAYLYDKPEIAVGETISVVDIDPCRDAYTSQRYSDALQECGRLADEGQSRALYLLADMYRNGLGVQKDMARVAVWYRRAAEEGQSRAQYLLADLYRNGLGVKKNIGKAATWYRRAAEQGHTGAQVSLDLMLALDIRNITQMDGGGGPRVCLEFTETLLPIRSSALGDYVGIEPRAKLAASVAGRNLCLSGLSYGQKYDVTIKAGLRGNGGFVVGADRKIDFRVNDRKQKITFDTRKYVLPTGVSRGLPVRTVNLDAIDVKLYRVDARMLTQLQPWILGKINGSKLAQLRDDSGELLWRGSVVVANKPNAEVTTLLDLASVADVDGPGIYVVAATTPGDGSWRWSDVPTQWFVQSDIGISTYTARDGLHVRLRSLGTGAPLANGRLTLLARNNKELGSVRTDRRGLASLAPGLIRGEGGNAPAVLTVETPGNDFNFLILDKSVLDISDRDVAGRPYPGPIDAYVYTERGVYRPGEAVHIYGIVRDQRTSALTDLPLTLVVERPDQQKVVEQSIASDHAGGFHYRLPLAPTAWLGNYQAAVLAGNDKIVGTVAFRVDDYVPETIESRLKAGADLVRPDAPLEVDVSAEYLAGGAAAGLTVLADASIKRGRARFADFPEFVFGLQDLAYTPRRLPKVRVATDAHGEATFSLHLDSSTIAGVREPLDLIVNVAVLDFGGRANRSRLALPIDTSSFYIGLRALFENGRVGRGETASFEIVAVDRIGRQIDLPSFQFDIVEEWFEYDWYESDGRWKYNRTKNGRLLRHGELSEISSESTVSLELGPGRYRLEVFDETGEVATSSHFAVGRHGAVQAADVPDRLAISLGAGPARPGLPFELSVHAPFPGKGTLVVATDRIIETIDFEAGQGVNSIAVTPTEAWEPGAHLLATIIRPMTDGDDYLPRRAVGLAWLPVAGHERHLELTMDAAQEIRPNTKLSVAVRLSGKTRDAMISVAVVDEGVLRLTNHRSPDPSVFFFGPRRLGIALGDNYGKLIEGRDGDRGELRSGGDEAEETQARPPGATFFKTIAIATAPSRVNGDGIARFELAIPDFEGRARLMAVAYSPLGVGAAAQSVVIRNPVSADAILPRFMALGDVATAMIRVVNRTDEDVAGHLAASAGTSSTDQTMDLPAGASVAVELPLEARSLQPIKVALLLEAGGETVTKSYQVPVRAAQYPSTRRLTAELNIRGGALNLDTEVLDGFMLEGAKVSMTVSSAPTLDVAGLLGELALYPYGCIEQTSSKLLALLYYNDLAEKTGIPKLDDLEERVDVGIARILDMQRFDGAFGFWNARGDAKPWLTAYATDTLLRARAAGYSVPSFRTARALDWLDEHGDGIGTSRYVQSYARYVLAKAGKGEPGDYRYFADRYFGDIEATYLAAQQAVYFRNVGDEERYSRLMASLESPKRRTGFDRIDYGSDLRDMAFMVVMMREAGVDTGRLDDVVENMLEAFDRKPYTSTQEKAWLVLAARSVMHGGKPLDIAVNDRPVNGAATASMELSVADLRAGVSVRNRGAETAFVSATISGAPSYDLGAAGDGLAITKRFITIEGKELDLDAVDQGDLVVVVLSGEAKALRPAHQLLVTDLLPAGLEIENPDLGGADISEKLGLDLVLSKAKHTEARDDRFVAAVDLESGAHRTFAFAYIARATMPGTFKAPGAYVEDMYQPRYFARSEVRNLTVRAPR